MLRTVFSFVTTMLYLIPALIYSVAAIWSDYNPIDGAMETVYIRKTTNHTIPNQQFTPEARQRAVRYDDDWAVIKKPTHRPTHAPTNYPSKYPTLTPSISPTMIPTHSPSPFPTIHPTKRPTKHPITSKPTKYPTVNDDEILDHLIAARQASKRNVVKLYAADSFYLMDELEKELLSKTDADAFIFRTAFNAPKSLSVSIGGYFTLTDDAFHTLQARLRSMVSLEFDQFDNFIQNTVPILLNLPDSVFDSICYFARIAFIIM